MTSYSSGAVSCSEMQGTQKITISVKNQPQASVDLMCAWGDRYALVQDIVGGQRQWPHGGWANPPVAQSAAVAPFTGSQPTSDGEAILYESAVVSLTYSHEVTDFISESLESNTQMWPLDSKEFHWEAINADGKHDRVTDEQAPTRIVHSVSLVRTLFNRTPPISTAILTLVGSVNAAPYVSTLLGLTFAAETLLWKPATLKRTIKTDGSAGINIDLKLDFQPQGWNSFWRPAKPGGPGFDRILTKDNTQYRSNPLGDFSPFVF